MSLNGQRPFLVYTCREAVFIDGHYATLIRLEGLARR